MSEKTFPEDASDLHASFKIFSHRSAPLTAGDYAIRLRQTVTYGPQKKRKTLGVLESTRRHFTVAGPRFALAEDQIDAVYPPPGGFGDYSETHPHVTLRRASLPWERAADTERTGEPSPWLALIMVLENEEAEILSAAAGGLTGLAEIRLSPEGQTILENEPTSGDAARPDAPLLTLPSETADAAVKRARVLSMTAALAKRIVPDREEIGRLAGVLRRRRPGETASDEDDRAVVVCGRRPAPGRCTLLLISLEGQTPVAANGADKDPRHFICLGSWRFNCEASAQGRFHEVASALKIGFLGEDLTIGHADAPAAGGLRVTCRTRRGSRLLAVYRGPLTPQPVTVDLPARPFEVRRADELLLPATQDASYAAAWEIGRLTAAADPSGGLALAEWWRCCIRHDKRMACAEDAERLCCGAPAGRTMFPMAWLADLARLQFLPFDYLVPSEMALPIEALRLFVVDPNWIECLVAGALSVGRPPVDEKAERPEVAALMQSLRVSGWRGCLVRSRLVSGWNGVELWGGIESGKTVAGRLRRCGKDVLLVLFDEEVNWIEFRLPADRPHFEAKAMYAVDSKPPHWIARRLVLSHAVRFVLD